MKLEGKKLLILGATPSEVSLVKRAQELGVYAIVTDYNTDHSLSPAKDVADEYWDISWSDIDSLYSRCLDEKVDGITAGYSELRVDAMLQLCGRLKLPCYITDEQLEVTRDKRKFKDFCGKCNVPIVKEYSAIEEVSSFPVIVKPVDRAGSIGISIASNRTELEEAYLYAMDKSIAKNVIIEDYISDGVKFDVYYGVEDGEITMLSTCDTINAKANGGDKVVQSCWLYPSRSEKLFMAKVDDKLRNMIKEMKIHYGCIFFSGFLRADQSFVFFECGFRLEGAHQYEYTKRRGLYNFNDLFIYHALTGDIAGMEKGPSLNKDLKFADVNIYAKSGIIKQIAGVEKVESVPECILSLVRGRIGQECDDSRAILDKVAQFGFASESPEKLSECIDLLYRDFSVLGNKDEDLIYDKVDSLLVRDWWN